MPSNRLIFLVDDDPMYAEMAMAHLANDPRNTVMYYASGEECIKNLYNEPALVILDYNLNMNNSNAEDGMQILQKIRKYDPEIRVVMLSSQEHYGVALQTIAKGAEQYIVKDPTAFRNLDAIIQTLG